MNSRSALLPVIATFEKADADRLRACAEHFPAQASEILYLAEFLRLGPSRLIETRDLERLVLRVGDEFLPVVVNDGSESLCYLVSPEVHYVRYMEQELEKIENNRTARLVRG